ncbi:MAG: radical SAM protein, partial [Mangrovicoccus sp.]
MSNAANPIDQSRRKGRGANSNDPGRFDIAREPFHDGWDMEEELPPLRTQVSEEQPKTIIARNSSPDIPFDRSINMYRGCEHGCIYCYARPSHAYLGLSPGLDFETRLIAKPTAPALLVEELRKRRYKVQPLAIGTNTDAYQPIERDRRLMRQVLEVLRDFRHPVTITTKGSLIERDLDILA